MSESLHYVLASKKKKKKDQRIGRLTLYNCDICIKTLRVFIKKQ